MHGCAIRDTLKVLQPREHDDMFSECPEHQLSKTNTTFRRLELDKKATYLLMFPSTRTHLVAR